MKKILIILIVLLGLFLQNNAMAVSLSYSDSSYLGFIHSGEPASPENEVIWINNLTLLSAGEVGSDGLTFSEGGSGVAISGSDRAYFRDGSSLLGPFSEAVIEGSIKDEPATNSAFDNMFNASGYSYILGKYDGPNLGSFVWYSAEGFDGIVELPDYNPFDPDSQQYGLSHISAYNPVSTPVPEPATMLLLGFGLVGLTGFKRVARKR